MEDHVAEIILSVTTFSKQKNVLQQTENALELFICLFNPMCQTISKHLEVNFKNLLGIELVTDVIFLVL